VPLLACIGGAHVDRRGVLRGPLVLGTSNPGALYTDLGGVARNVAQNLARLECPVILCSRVGDDEAGRQVLAQPLDTSLITISRTASTASYTAILESSGELVIGVADMAVYDELTPAILAPHLSKLRAAVLWFLDSNLPAATLAWLLESAEVPVAVDAISVAKALRLVPLLPRIRYLFCNLAQAGAMACATFRLPGEAAESLAHLGAVSGIVSAGPDGIAIYQSGAVTVMPALKATPRDVTGAGDALVAGTLYGLSLQLDLLAAARLGLAAAAIAVESRDSAAPNLTVEALRART
jgi:pseudouridine kinase